MNNEIKYNNCKRIITKLSWAYSLRSNFEQEDLFSEGNLIFAKCCQTFDPDKCKFSTYFYMCLSGHYKNMIRLENKVNKNTFDSFDGSVGLYIFFREACKVRNSQYNAVSKVDAFEKLSIEAKDVINIILNGPYEVISTLTSPVTKVFQYSKIKKYIKKRFGFDKFSKIDRELKKFVKNFE